MNILKILIVAILSLVLLNLLFYLKIWIRALKNRVPLTYAQVIRMKIDGQYPGMIVDAYIDRKQRGQEVSIEGLKSEFKARK
jgi:uncharacterized protein YqfA (UPF0365 family)